MKKIGHIQSLSFRTARGFTLIDTMVAIGLASVVLVTTLAVVIQAGRDRTFRNQVSTLLAVREHIHNGLARYINFQDTVHLIANSTFSCLRSHLDCSGLGTNRNFNLVVRNNVSATGSVVTTFTDEKNTSYNAASTSPHYGFDHDGVVCTSTTSTPNKDCPIRVDFYWEPICTTCNPALISITVSFKTYRNFLNPQVSRGFGFTMLKTVYDANTFETRPPYPP